MLVVPFEKLVGAIRRVQPYLPDAIVEEKARCIVADTDPRLEKNVLQWINGETITDIWVKPIADASAAAFSIRAILLLRGETDFLYALEAMNTYLTDPTKGRQMIWSSRR